jgi:hypothetical protein
MGATPDGGTAVELELYSRLSLGIGPTGYRCDGEFQEWVIGLRDLADCRKGGIHGANTESGLLNHLPGYLHLHRSRRYCGVPAYHIEVKKAVFFLLTGGRLINDRLEILVKNLFFYVGKFRWCRYFIDINLN